MTIDEMITDLRAKAAAKLNERAAEAQKITEIREKCITESRDPSDDEAATVTAAVAIRDERQSEADVLIARADELEAEERSNLAAQEVARSLGAPARVISEPETYRKGGENSYFRDLVSVQTKQSRDSMERLQRNDREVRALTTTDGAVGEFVPPLWMIEDYVRLARSGRVIANQVRSQPLPAGTDSISLPRLTGGTAVDEQATQNTAVQNTDATSDSVTASVTTLAGQQVVPVQLIEQSPINMDEVLLADLAADYAVKADRFVISNNAANKRGLLSVSGLNAVTYTDASPTVSELYPKLADGWQQIATNRFLPAQKVFMHPRRWAWFLAAVDTTGRPLVVPAAGGMNAVGSTSGQVAEGYVGDLTIGLPVYVDPNIPTNLGAGTNEDRVIIARTDDVIFYEGTPKAEAFRETKADQLSVLLRFYNYAAIHASRCPKSISVIAGTGLVAPTF